MVFEQSRSIEVVILRTIRDGLADGRARQNVIVEVLPFHGEWSQVPASRSGDTRALRIGLLMTCRAREGGHAEASPSAYDVERMHVPIVALLGIRRGGVTIHAARVREY